MKFLLGLVVGFLIIPAGMLIYFQSGNAPVAASDPPLPFEAYLATHALHARINRQMPQRDVSATSAADLQNAAMTYQMDCSFCHGLPQRSTPAAAKGMFPRPPELFKSGEMVTDDPPGETYWKIKNGIRLSGMPSFRDTLSEKDIWQVTALVARADKLPQQVLDALKPSGESMISPEPAPPPKTNSPTSQKKR